VESRKKLENKILDQANKVTAKGDKIYCLGDLFDKAKNSEEVIVQGIEIAERSTAVLAGNHDVENRDNAVSSLDIVAEALSGRGSKIVFGNICETPEIYSCKEPKKNIQIHLVGHQLNQEKFEEKIDLWTRFGKKEENIHILCLHCNYNLSEEFVGNDSTLNLTREKAKKLLEFYDYILIGHEHQPRVDFEGRLMLLGNIHPTSFSDISDKYVWYFNTGTNSFEKEKIWDIEQGYLEMNWEDLLSGKYKGTEAEFISIIGEAPPTKLPEIAKAVRKLWEENQKALMIRNGVTSEELAPVSDAEGEQGFQDVPSKVAASLSSNPEILALWNSYLQKVQA
jgi:DNA repair exonuclease SbcCD nuclease subunit